MQPAGNSLFEKLIETVAWPSVEARLREHIAPVISDHPTTVPLIRAYWGDCAAKLAWDGASSLPESASDIVSDYPDVLPLPGRSHILAQMRRPLNQIGAMLLGDVFWYLSTRGDATQPGEIPLRVLATLSQAQKTKTQTGEPLVVLTNSMGGEIMYDIVTHFLPRLPEYDDVQIDYWCSVASQIGLFEEMKLFLASSDQYGAKHGNRVPFPDRKRLVAWWNAWDIDDMISYSVRDIIEGVDDTPYHVGRLLFDEHLGYLQADGFYKEFASRLRRALSPES